MSSMRHAWLALLVGVCAACAEAPMPPAAGFVGTDVNAAEAGTRLPDASTGPADCSILAPGQACDSQLRCNREPACLCGNGVIDPGEECDERSPGCMADCTWQCSDARACADEVICQAPPTCDLVAHVCVEGEQYAPGSACPGGVCDALGNCLGCDRAGEPCTLQDACLTGLIVCSDGLDTAVCQPGEPEPTDTPCGDERACDGFGNCVSCDDEGEPCVPANPCVDGVLSCLEGRPLCAWGDPVPAGVPCEEGLCDGRGGCSPCLDQAELCDGLDNDCDGDVDEALVPPACELEAGVCLGTVRSCGGSAGWLPCTAATYGSSYEAVEVSCDGLDNDCDGVADEELAPRSCPLQLGVCEGATQRCQGEQGWLSCEPGDYGAAYEQEERSCDGLDNDCDGAIDEVCSCIFGETRPCGTDEGVCRAGIEYCWASGWSGLCEGSFGADAEVCDGLDNDCDGEIDDNLTPPSCERVFGVCAGATRECNGTMGWGQCGAAQYGPDFESDETRCDGRDNDCDGAVDETCGCAVGDTRVCGVDEGTCRLGLERCTTTGWSGVCEGAQAPTAELCDGRDNDCDSEPDEDLTPPACSEQRGVCLGSVRRCGGDDGWLACDAEDFGADYELREQTCDGLDNDCDGQVDEGCGCVVGETRPCGSDEGECAQGVEPCLPTGWSGTCEQSVEPKPEQCDGLDNDCNGQLDEQLEPLTCELTLGVCAGATARCGGVDGWLECDAEDYGEDYEQDETRCDGLDNDCDGTPDENCGCVVGTQLACGSAVGECAQGIQRCTADGWSDDCEGDIEPVAEACDGLDNDCDGAVDDGLPDNPCGLFQGVCAGAVRRCGGDAGWLQCDATDYGSDYEEAEETRCDGLDNDCDGQIDETCECQVGTSRACGSDVGTCEVGQERCLSTGWTGLCEGATSPVPEVCDGLDNDCDGEADEQLSPPACALGVGVCEGSVRRCVGSTGWAACTADDYGAAYQQDETQCDGLDNDCDGETDEGCVCVVGTTRPCGSAEGSCEQGVEACLPDGWSGSCEGGIGPANERCDGLDNDCDGVIDEELVPEACAEQRGVCGGSVARCGGSEGWLPCEASDYGDRHEVEEATCDGLDNDCDGQPDESCECVVGLARACGSNVGECVQGLERCEPAGWTGLCEAETPPRVEVCDGLDNDCDGDVDDGLTPEPCAAQNGVCAGSVRRCGGAAGWLTCDEAQFPDDYEADETTCDGLDNDCDGQPDESCDCVVGATRACGSDVGQCSVGVEMCQPSGWSGVCEGELVPGAESCNGLDDDCDGSADEDLVPPACVLQLGVCETSVARCGGEEGWQACSAEDYGELYQDEEDRCDGLDNDCDGDRDETCECIVGALRPCGSDVGQCARGQQLCTEDGWSEFCADEVVAESEVCDGLDNDCDGEPDEDLQPAACALQLGVCGGSVARCGGDSGWLQCDGSDYGADYEVEETLCDGLDNDCDGVPDESCICVVGSTRDCGSDVGECALGIETCTPNGWSGLCEGEVEAASEVCDGLDNNCDGSADEALEPPQCALQQGVCVGATARCGGALGWQDCAGTEDYGVQYEVEETTCDGLDNDCDGQVDESCECVVGSERACGSSVGQCAQGLERCTPAGWSGLCEGEVAPAPEACDGLDNDCNGQVDDALTAPDCELGQGVCAGAVKVCGGVDGWLACDPGRYGPSYEVEETACDGLDNDCDRATDEACACVVGETRACGSAVGQCRLGTETCTPSGWSGDCVGETAPAGEICDGLDNDCDGLEDERLTAPSCVLQRGVCNGSVSRCGGAAGWLACNEQDYGADYQPTETRCDGVDNDCDGAADEVCECVVGSVRACGSATGQCQQGQETCLPGGWSGVCEGEVTATVERCDGVDNDCNGAADDGLTAPACDAQLGVCAGSVQRCGGLAGWQACGAADFGADYQAAESACDGLDNDCDGDVDETCECVVGDTRPCGSDIGQCVRGVQVCTPVGWSSVCTGETAPEPEVCDGLDNDCDGSADEQLDPPACADQAGVCAGSVRRCGGVEGWLACTAEDFGAGYEAAEVSCDGLDNDCDGSPDEVCECVVGGQRSCGTDVGLCVAGSERCLPDGWSGVCDGQTVAAPEVCDGEDNDCDGEVDEELSVPACPLQQGVCAGSAQRCGGSAGWLACGPVEYGGAYQGVESRCDGVDNDCDGAADETCACVVGSQRACGTNVGECRVGSEACVAIGWSGECEGGIAPTNETCDGLDNDCDGTVDDGVQSRWWRDGDSDGFGDPAQSVLACDQPPGYVSNSQDCDDATAQSRPGGTEVCDNLDNDCDGTVDEGVRSTWFRDADADGFGDANVTTLSCSQPPGFVANNADCDDSTNLRRPNLSERCDGLDNNCNGSVDEGVQPTWWQDADGDGFGNPSRSRLSCGRPPGYVDNRSDCDDSTAWRRPNLGEICDGLDNDCNGSTGDACPRECQPRNWNGHLYWFCNGDANWTDAANTCRSQGLWLVRIDSVSENNWVRDRARDILGTNDFWIGANDRGSENRWVWHDGTHFWQGRSGGNSVGGRYSNWEGGEPNNSWGEDCGELYVNDSGRDWNDEGCGTVQEFACERY